MTEDAVSSNALMVIDDRAIMQPSKSQEGLDLIRNTMADALALVDKYTFISIVDDDSKVEAEKAFIEVGKFVRDREAAQKVWGAPLFTVKSTFDGAMKQSIKPAAGLKDLIATGIMEYNQKKDREARAAAEEERKKYIAAEKRAAKKGVEPALPETPVVPIEATNTKKADGMAYTRRWFYQVIDESLLPDAYKVTIPNESAIAAAVEAGKYIPAGSKLTDNRCKIPGVRIWKEDKPKATGRG